MSRVRVRRPKMRADIDLPYADEFEVRMGRGTPGARLAVELLDDHPYRLPRFWQGSAVECAKEGDLAGAHRWLHQAREHITRMDNGHLRPFTAGESIPNAGGVVTARPRHQTPERRRNNR